MSMLPTLALLALLSVHACRAAAAADETSLLAYFTWEDNASVSVEAVREKLGEKFFFKQCEPLEEFLTSGNVSTNGEIGRQSLQLHAQRVLDLAQFCQHLVIQANRFSWKTWAFGTAVVSVMSAASLTGALVIPFMEARIYQTLLSFMVALAVGSLSGSSVFILIPEAFGLVDPEGDHTQFLNKGAAVIGGIYLFFFTERFLKFTMFLRKRSRRNSSSSQHGEAVPPICSVKARTLHYDHHTHDPPTHLAFELHQELGEECSESSSPDSGGGHKRSHRQHEPPHNTRSDEVAFIPKTVKGGHNHCDLDQIDKKRPIATVAWMVIFGDGIHNFIDGLAIGAACTTSLVLGLSTSVAVFAEELPHELGDFAILLSAGMTWKQALFYNFLSALSCFVGMVIGILLGELAEASAWIFGVAGGMFLYISLVDMMPEMSEDLVDETKAPKWRLFLLQTAGLLCGWGLMYSFARWGSAITLDLY